MRGEARERKDFQASPVPGEVNASKANQRAGWRNSPRSGHHHAVMIATHPAALSGEKGVVRDAGDWPGSMLNKFNK
jgi:hypothetical protein